MKQVIYFYQNLEFMSKEKVISDVRDLVIEKMKSDGRTFVWLSEATSIPYDTLNGCIKRKLFSLSDDNLAKINDVLGTDFKQG